jgi:hypothetical protein
MSPAPRGYVIVMFVTAEEARARARQRLCAHHQRERALRLALALYRPEVST